ncbi:MAG: glycoside hydrolase [Oscillospiraceae bacterium]|jgi:alpha-D-xyloside xylohydrolase|nr:glycoside hydrolase [Oscillospiraceae bacterium]
MSEQVFPGVYRLTLGDPERLTPVSLRLAPPAAEALALMGRETAPPCPMTESQLSFRVTPRGCMAELPLDGFEQLYGFGLQLKSFVQTGKKKTIRVNADPVADTGDSHAPIPYYVSTEGYAVLADTARQVSFYCGANDKVGTSERTVAIDVPGARGLTLYIFTGPTMLDAVRRYNLFSGGGALPPAWGLGIWYRCHTKARAAEAERFAREFREKELPVTVLGLEPGWHTAAYSTSYRWNEENFPEHEAFLARLKGLGYQINLWEHVFVHPTAEFYDDIMPYAGDYEVWHGLTPDFALPEAREIFSGYHRRAFAEQGISGFKLDECDGSDFTGGWSYPNCARFPSGLDGEQMHNLIGLLYQHTVRQAFDPAGRRTWGLVRASSPLAAPSPFTLYSDLYQHGDYLRGLVNMGFSGLLWTPEVRDAASVEDLVRRIQTVIFSPVAMINAWPFPYPPWMQVNSTLNHQGIPMENQTEAEGYCRDLFRLRMAMIPYLYTAFARYAADGTPPVRALVLDDPEDDETWTVDDAVLIGSDLYAAPMTAGQTARRFYLPRGRWADYFAPEQILEGGKWYTFDYPLERFPFFVRSGALIPWAEPLQTVPEHPTFLLRPKYYGPPTEQPVSVTLYEDDGGTLGAAHGTVTLTRDPDGLVTLARDRTDGHILYRLA